MKIRPSILVGEVMLGAIAIICATNGWVEATLGITGIIGTTMHKLVESEEKGQQKKGEK